MPDKEKANILIVDDKMNNIFVLEEILSHPGRNFIRAIDGREALKAALDEEVDLIILDVQMPNMDGFEVAQILKSHKRTRDIPIIFASAEKKEHQFMLKGFEEGAVDYLYKPLDPALTKARVSVLLQLHLQKKELIRKNLMLEKYTLEIQQLNADLESFSYSVSHDLRAPLRSINGYARIIQEEHKEQLNEEIRRLFGNIQNSAGRMGVLIDSLLEFSRLGRRKIAKSGVNMMELVQKVLQDLHQDRSNKTSIHIGPLPPAEGDPGLLHQVMMNLVSNAIKYSAKKEAPVIEIGSSEKEEEYIYFVKDNGTGFNMAYVHKLFGVFQRLHNNDEFPGSGVGLAIVQRIVNKHGGRVWAEGRPGEGATFLFSLPRSITKKDDIIYATRQD